MECVVPTNAATAIDIAGCKAMLDRNVKTLLSEPELLSFILKHTIPELKDFAPSEIATFLNRDEINLDVPIAAGKSGSVVAGKNPSMYIPGEGEVVFDIYISLVLPPDNNQIAVRLFVDLEVQRDFNPGYSLMSRGIFYGARMLSVQMDHNDVDTHHYGNLSKVYSVWICLDVPNKYANTISRYRITEEQVYGEYTAKQKDYDLMEVIMVRLPASDDKVDTSLPIFEMLGALLSKTMESSRRKETLESLGIPMTMDIEKGVTHMCDYSEGIWLGGISKGKAQEQFKGISILAKTLLDLGVTLEEALNRVSSEYRNSTLDVEQIVRNCYKC